MSSHQTKNVLYHLLCQSSVTGKSSMERVGVVGILSPLGMILGSQKFQVPRLNKCRFAVELESL